MKNRLLKGLALAATMSFAVGVAIVPAQAASEILIWADETRGPQLKSLIDGNTTIAPGYVVKVKFFSSFDALNGAFDKATAASGPDVMTGAAGLAASAGKSSNVIAGVLGITKA